MCVRNIILYTCAVFAFITPVFAAGTQSPFVVVPQKVNPVMQPKQPTDAIKECAHNTLCASAVGIGAAYLGVPRKLVTAAIAAIPQATRTGEEGHYSISLPAGYQYCRASIHTISVVPATGDRASVMSSSSNAKGVAIYTWTPRQGSGEGRSWIEADYKIYGVRNDLADQYRSQGKCHSFGKVLIACRGARGINHGQPSCGNARD